MRTLFRNFFVGSMLAFTGLPMAQVYAEDSPTAIQQPSASELLLKAEREFDIGNFKGSEDSEVEVSKNQEKLSVAEKERLYLLQARLAFAFQRGNAAIDDAFNRLAAVNPRATLDALKDPPQLFSRWQDAVARAAAVNNAKSQESPRPALLQNPTVAKIDGAVRSGADFWLGLFPFGVGHFIHNENGKGATYLTLESTYLLAMNSVLDGYAYSNEYYDSVSTNGIQVSKDFDDWERESAKKFAYSMALPLGFAGIWGYEVLDMVPILAKSSVQGAAWTRFVLSFAPFGVGQYKNGEQIKAVGLASTQVTLLLLSGYLDSSSGRGTARILFLGSLAFGAFDGWRGHNWDANPAAQPRLQFSIFPFLAKNKSDAGVQLLAQYRF